MTKAWKITLTILAVLIIAIGGWWLWFSYSGSSKEIEAVADQFQPDSSWVLSAETITPPRNVCLSGTCPSAFRSWKVDHVVSKAELADVLKRSGWDFSIEGECDISKGGAGSGTIICEAKGYVERYSIKIAVIGANDHLGETRVSLSIR